MGTMSILVGVVLIIVTFEWRKIDPRIHSKEFWVFMVLLLIGAMLWILRACQIDIGNPFNVLQEYNPYHP